MKCRHRLQCPWAVQVKISPPHHKDTLPERSMSAASKVPSFALTLPENCVEYMLFVIEADGEPKKTLSSLETVRKASVRLCNQLTKDYIWQRDGFSLEIKSEQGMFRIELPRSSRATLTWTARPAIPSWSDRPWRLDRR